MLPQPALPQPAAGQPEAGRAGEGQPDVPVVPAEAASGPSTPVPPAEPVRVRVGVGRDHASTGEERRRYREQAGAQHERHVVAVARALAQRPALRGGAVRPSREAEDVTAADLAALRAYLCGEPSDLDQRLRTADPSDALAHTACALSGLRVLPACRGAVFRAARLAPALLERYRPGLVLLEPGFTAATTSAPDPTAEPDAVVYVLWSQTARRTGWLDATGSDAEVVFPAGTEFLTLAVEPAPAGWSDGPCTLVHLREHRRPGAAGPDVVPLDEADRTLLARLRAAVAARVAERAAGVAEAERDADGSPAAPVPARSLPRHGFALGLDDRGLPFLRA
ncbi:hypothetical protein GXW83_21775 [Streptacidiphilus sp. PB12-B1b]|uniref:hypothetical protein n=1 Tax=Streptacidiphilus sp. PB12-B1b TaxID=2705012 RepID=UPI0015FD997F|nr:hypothetical protein [Streptacidiphilus sp. PB12-B1b]QMU77931.1 hypothetical protein GXW83_21775 [Streptacidiphilus sp. PB12-B1b]